MRRSAATSPTYRTAPLCSVTCILVKSLIRINLISIFRILIAPSRTHDSHVSIADIFHLLYPIKTNTASWRCHISPSYTTWAAPSHIRFLLHSHDTDTSHNYHFVIICLQCNRTREEVGQFDLLVLHSSWEWLCVRTECTHHRSTA